MRVARRQQITEIVTHRHISHALIHENTKYSRIEKHRVIVPAMNGEVIVSKPKILWRKYVGERVVEDIPKRETKELEALFQSIELNERNGNGEYIVPDVTYNTLQ